MDELAYLRGLVKTRDQRITTLEQRNQRLTRDLISCKDQVRVLHRQYHEQKEIIEQLRDEYAVLKATIT
jgi:peptidoglycan hydrolase CwlO-like protein